MKKDCFVRIKRENDEMPEETSSGIYHNKNGKHYILLERGDRYILDEGTLSVRRNGIDLLFSMERPFSCLYPTDFGSLPLTFDQVLLSSNEREDGLRILLKYRMSQDGAVVGDSALTIDITYNRPDPV
ncbi:MAG: DUF1934 domain-containing protein [Lachnospiraceae bacterium]|nr:DUF1934 domain-containing protein [Lachnospiraceae bacterium]